MVSSLRPSKAALYKYLKSDLEVHQGEVGIDAASADMKNYSMFRTRCYVGIDCNLDALRKGQARHPAAHGLCANLQSFELTQSSVDVCVSTNTLEHLTQDGQIEALERMSDVLKTDGWLFLNKHHDDSFFSVLAFLEKKFSQVERIYYRNFVSRLFEWWLGPKQIEAMSPRRQTFMRFLVRCLSQLEYLTSPFQPLNNCSYFRCTQKRVRSGPKSFGFMRSRQLEINLYVQGEKE